MNLEFKVPKELEEEMKRLSQIGISLMLTRMIGAELEKLAKLKRIIKKSQLTEEDVEEFSKEVDEELSKRFKESLR